MKFEFLLSAILLISVANAQTEETAVPTLIEAQKAYVAGNMKVAADKYEQVCPTVEKEKQPECFLWNVLALSQTGIAKDFSKAGKRLDSLIQATGPENPVFADLLMTRAQFQLYLGKYTNAADALIRAIENAKSHQVPVLQKVCKAVQSKLNSKDLQDRCESLGNPETMVQKDSVVAKPTPAVQPNQEPAPVQAAPVEAEKKAPPKQDSVVEAKATSSTSASMVQAPEIKDVWVLQLGAFGQKSNADLLVSNLTKRGIHASIEVRAGETKTLYIVLAGSFDTKEKAIDFGAQKLAPLKIEFRAILKK